MDLGEEHSMCKMPLLSHIKGAYHQHDLSPSMLNLIIWLRECLSGFSTIKLMISPPLSYYALWKEPGTTMCNQYLRNEELRGVILYLLRPSSTYINYLQFFYAEDTHFKLSQLCD